MHYVHPFSQKAVFYSHAQHTETKARNAELTEGYRTISLKGGTDRHPYPKVHRSEH